MQQTPCMFSLFSGTQIKSIQRTLDPTQVILGYKSGFAARNMMVPQRTFQWKVL